jgi:hypothetical protein
MTGRRWLALLLTLALVLGSVPQTALAQELDGAQSVEVAGGQETQGGVVTGFPEEGPILRLTVAAHSRPTLEELTAQMPEYLTVLAEGEEQSIPVAWCCVGEDYESGQDYYYQFSPQWDEETWTLDSELDVMKNAPYVGVFVTEDGLSTQDAESVELECYNYFTGKMGLSSAAACGILANIYCECSFKANNLQQYYEKKLGYTDESYTKAVDKGTYKNFAKDSAGYGLVQFTWWELKRDLLAYAQKKGTSIGDTQTQLEYLEISLGAKRIAALKAFPDTAQGAYDAGKYFCDEYERPGIKEQPVIRAKLARDTFWPKYSDAIAKAEAGVPNALSPPTPVSLTQTPTGLVYTWKGVAGAAKYRVYRNDGTGWKKLGTTPRLSWTDETVTSGKIWSYTVRCFNARGQFVSDCTQEVLSSEFWATPVLTSFKNTAQGVRLRWKSEGSPQYFVWRKLAGGKWEEPTPVQGTSYVDTTAQSGQWYVYTVRCADEEGKLLSERINSKKLLCLATPALKTPKNKGKGIRVSWNRVTGAQRYRVYRRTLTGKWKKIATVKGNKTVTYTDRGVKKKNGEAYYYTVRAEASGLLSGYEEPGALACRLSAPKLLAAAGKRGKLTATWKKSKKAQGYELRATRGKDLQTVSAEGGSTLKAGIKGLEKGNWQVRVRSWRKAGGTTCYSAWSGTKKVKVL